MYILIKQEGYLLVSKNIMLGERFVVYFYFTYVIYFITYLRVFPSQEG